MLYDLIKSKLMKKLFLYLLLLLPLAGCTVDVHYDGTPPPPEEIVTNIRVGGPYGNIAAVVVNYDIRAGSYYGPTVAVVDGNYIFENSIYGRMLGYIDGNYILDAPNGRTVAFINGQYIMDSPYGRTIAYMDGPADNVAGGLGAIYMLLFL